MILISVNRSHLIKPKHLKNIILELPLKDVVIIALCFVRDPHHRQGDEQTVSCPNLIGIGLLLSMKIQSMECSSMVSIGTFGPGDQGLNPGWFPISNSNQKLSFHK